MPGWPVCRSLLQEGSGALGPARTCSLSPVSPPRERSAGTLPAAPTGVGLPWRRGRCCKGSKARHPHVQGGGRGRTQSRRSLQKSTRARTPALQAGQRGQQPGVPRVDQVGRWLGNPGPCRRLGAPARGSQEAPVATLAGGKPESARVEHRGQAPEEARTAKGSKDGLGRRGERAGAGFPYRALARSSGRRALGQQGCHVAHNFAHHPACSWVLGRECPLHEDRPGHLPQAPRQPQAMTRLSGQLVSKDPWAATLRGAAAPSVRKAHHARPQGWPALPTGSSQSRLPPAPPPGPRAVVPPMGCPK